MKKYAWFVGLSLQIAFGLPVKHYYRTTEFPRMLLESRVQALEIRIGITMLRHYDALRRRRVTQTICEINLHAALLRIPIISICL